MKKSNLPVLDISDSNNIRLEGDLILSEPILKIGESEIVVEKTLSKYNISDNGDIGEKIELDTTDWDIKSESDFEITLTQKRVVKMKFIREPKALQHFIGLTSIILSALFEIRDGEGIEIKAKVGGIAFIVQDEIFSWVQMASSLTLVQPEKVEIEGAMKFFNYYMNNNSEIQRQALIFLARPKGVNQNQ